MKIEMTNSGRSTADISTKNFDRILYEMVGDMSIEKILSYGDIYNVLSEELNNAILEQWEEEFDESLFN